MTMAAGFNFDGGILVCADTQYTSGAALSASKIFRREYPNGNRSVFVTVGSMAYSRMALQECEFRLQELASAGPLTQRQMQVEIEGVLTRVFQGHIAPHPDRGYSNGPGFCFVVALYSTEDGLGMYHTQDSAIFAVRGYTCLGSGEYLGHYLLRPLYQENLNLEYILTMAVSALVRIKKYDANCGGNSEFVVLNKDGSMSDIKYYDIRLGEAYSDEFDRVVRPLFLDLGRRDLGEEEFRKDLMDFQRSMERLRDKLRRNRGTYQLLLEALGSSKPPPRWLDGDGT